MISKANRIDNSKVVEGDIQINRVLNKYFIVKSVKSTYAPFEINPPTLKHSFDGISWYTEDEIKEALAPKFIGFTTDKPLEVNTKDTKSCENELYIELLYAVENKFPNETRHETALRYIKQAESSDEGFCVNKHEPK